MPESFASRPHGNKNVFVSSKHEAQFSEGFHPFSDESAAYIKICSVSDSVNAVCFFYENYTVYLVLEYTRGLDLQRLCNNCGGKLKGNFAEYVMIQTAKALVPIHRQGIVHENLCPESIVVSNGKIRLFNFSDVKSAVGVESRKRYLNNGVFLAPEQHEIGTQVDIRTDIYSLCATFYYAFFAYLPVDAVSRYRGHRQSSLYENNCKVNKRISKIIDMGMELEASKRYQDLTELLRDFETFEIREQAPTKYKIVKRSSPTPRK